MWFARLLAKGTDEHYNRTEVKYGNSRNCIVNYSTGQKYYLQLTTVGDVAHTVDAPLTIDIIGQWSSFIAELDVATYPAFV